MKNLFGFFGKSLSAVIVMWAIFMLSMNGKTQAQPLTVTVTQVDSVQCYLMQNGSITISVSGGTPSYSYNWNTNPPQTMQNPANLPAGTYTVTVTDGSSNTATASATVYQPTQLNFSSLTADSVKCFGDSTGSINASGSGGTPPYSYSWFSSTSGKSGQNLNHLPSGFYEVTISDHNGCTGTDDITISTPNQLMAVISNVSPVLCYGQCNGSATVNVTGGTPPYSYEWNTAPIEVGQTAVNLCSGIYTVTVTDHNGCTITETDTIGQPTQLGVILSADSVRCFGSSTGSITSIDTGGTPTYHYLWSNGQTGKNLINVVAGVYTLTLTDHNGCTAVATSAGVLQPSPLTYNIDVAGTDTILKCSGAGYNIGSIALNVVGGTYPWSYQWSNGYSTLNIMNLEGGVYTVTITDHNGCSIIRSFTVTQPTGLIVQLQSHNEVDHTGNGEITSAVTGGMPPYFYVWSNGQFTPNDTGLSAGTYYLTVSDSNGCQQVATAVVSEAYGIKNIELSGETKVYPNPASEEIYVSSEYYPVNSIDIYNLLGEKIYTLPITVNRSLITVDIADIPSGVYIVEVKTRNGLCVKKFMKE